MTHKWQLRLLLVTVLVTSAVVLMASQTNKTSTEEEKCSTEKCPNTRSASESAFDVKSLTRRLLDF